MKPGNHARISAAVFAITQTAVHGQTPTPQQEAAIKQMLTQAQAAQLSAQGAGAQQPNVSPEQMQRMLQMLVSQPLGLDTFAGATQPAPVVPVILKQGDKQVSSSPQRRELAFMRTRSNDAGDAMKAQAMSEALSPGTAAAAKKLAAGMPYFGGIYSAADGLLHRGAPKELYVKRG